MAARPDQVRKLGFGAAMLLAGVVACAGTGRAEVRVSEPQPGVLVVEAHNATVDEVLAEIGKSQGMQFESAGPLTGQVSGTYRGQLSRVVLRLLDGYDVVIRSSPTGLRVKVVGDVKTRVAMPAAGLAMPLHPAVSSNVDADEDKARTAMAPPPPAAPAAPPPRPGPNAGPVLASGPALTPTHPKVSSNVDLDEERSAGGN